VHRITPEPQQSRECACHAAWQPLRPLAASTLRQVQAAAREKRRSDLRNPVRLPRVLQEQELQVRLGRARLARACCQRSIARAGEGGDPAEACFRPSRIVVERRRS
jgi:hypothetical protein